MNEFNYSGSHLNMVKDLKRILKVFNSRKWEIKDGEITQIWIEILDEINYKKNKIYTNNLQYKLCIKCYDSYNIHGNQS